jgi:L-fuculose-phosphate aldolase
VTAHDCYLGFLKEEDILLINLAGKVLQGEGELTSEQKLHLGIYNKFDDINVVLHTHSPYTTAFFHYFDSLDIFSFETRFYLGKVNVLTQITPTVTDIAPVLKGLSNNNIVVLKNHGVVAIGRNFKETFSLIELLEEQAKVNLLVKTIGLPKAEFSVEKVDSVGGQQPKILKRYKMLSKEHAQKLTDLVNNDSEVQDLGKRYDLTCTLAVKNQDTGQAMRFCYKQGRVVEVDDSDDAEFVIIGKSEILKKVFNREIDPFVATTQGKVKTKGDFAKMSKWYPVMVRTFKLWEQAPVE